MASTPRRRSARLSTRDNLPRSTARKNHPSNFQLDSLIERDETPEVNSIDGVISVCATNASVQTQLNHPSELKTPNTAPRPTQADMHPKTIHQTTIQAPDSGLRLGFTDVPANGSQSLASLQNSPTKMATPDKNAPSFEFKFRSESHLSNNAQKLMENLRDEAARIKAQMKAEKDAQDQKDEEADQMFSAFNATGRKIAKPKGKAGRFSDIHMADFKKLDSIANHASAYRANPGFAGFAQPTQQLLKRSGSKAGLDEFERPRTAGKGTPKRLPPISSLHRRMTSTIPFKNIPNEQHTSERFGNSTPAKRPRQSEHVDISAGRVHEQVESLTSKSSTLPRLVSGIPRGLMSPTKSSLARTTGFKVLVPSTQKPSMLPRSNSVKSLKATFEAARTVHSVDSTPSASPSKISRSESSNLMRPLPLLPREEEAHGNEKPTSLLNRSNSTKTLSSQNKSHNFSSRLPTFAGLKSILRKNREPPPLPISNNKPGTPKRPNTADAAAELSKKVDFTPSVKSRYAVKLAADSPSPAKHQATPGRVLSERFDHALYVLSDEPDETDKVGTEEWEDAESEVEYPTLPSTSTAAEREAPVVHTFSKKAQDHNRRESLEFKSIFTTLHHPSRDSPSVLTSIKTAVNKTNPTAHSNKVIQSPSSMSNQSPSTIRRVRASEAIQPFEDTIRTVPHGLPGKKRRRESNMDDNENGSDEDAKENRRLSVMPQVPGGWEDSFMEENEGVKRGGKRVRVETKSEEPKLEVKKASAAREAASKNAKDRKGRGILSKSRLNMLARPKGRN